ncbi:MAG: leucine-rich repeat domain-containing protein, partial [Rickettsiales bacterium]|nr:leucine-rich repeat domain-containing protein [Rickettsiales bacterium]
TTNLIPSDRNLKVVWYKSTDTNKTTPLADGSQIDNGDIITADAGCKDETLYTDMSDFDDDNKNELMYGGNTPSASGAEYSFRCSDGALAAEGTPGTKACNGYIPAHILYAATGTNDGIVINSSTSSSYNNGGVNDCAIDWGDNTASVCLNGNNPHAYSSAGDYHIRIYGEKFTGFCFYNSATYCGSDAAANSNYKTKLKEIYSLGKWDNITSMYYAFSNTSLNEISKNTFKYLTEVTSFYSTFYNCSSLTSIPAGLFDYNTKVTSFGNAFENCSNLASIPADLFKKNTEVTSFSRVFDSCPKLNLIPIGFFDNNKKVTSFSYAFTGWGIESIPANLFKVHDKVSNVTGTFRDCKNLKEIPAGLFDPANIAELPNHTTKVTDFTQVFYGCSGLTSIPADLFKNHKNVTYFSSAFSSCSKLASIPAGLFDENKAVTSFSNAFERCANLASIPADLFKYNTAVRDFNSVFSNCTKLACSDITSASTNWPRWNASGVTMTDAASKCKQ